MKELKVGERFSVTLEIVEQNSCDGCFFERSGCIEGEQLSCCHTERSDRKNIIFKEVNE